MKIDAGSKFILHKECMEFGWVTMKKGAQGVVVRKNPHMMGDNFEVKVDGINKEITVSMRFFENYASLI